MRRGRCRLNWHLSVMCSLFNDTCTGCHWVYFCSALWALCSKKLWLCRRPSVTRERTTTRCLPVTPQHQTSLKEALFRVPPAKPLALLDSYWSPCYVGSPSFPPAPRHSTVGWDGNFSRDGGFVPLPSLSKGVPGRPSTSPSEQAFYKLSHRHPQQIYQVVALPYTNH